MLGNLIGGFIVILIGVTLAPTVADTVKSGTDPDSNASTSANISGASASIFNLTTLFYSLAVASSGIGLAVVGFRKAGVM